MKEGPLEAAKITKTTIIAEITKISRFFKALTNSDEGNANDVNEDPRRSSENYKNYDNCENNKNLEIFQSH